MSADPSPPTNSQATNSPLSSLYRSATSGHKPRRSSPLSSSSTRNSTSPPLLSYRTHSAAPSSIVTRLDYDSDYDSDEGDAPPQLSALAQMLLNDSPTKRASKSSPTKATADSNPLSAVPATVTRNRSWSKSPDPNEQPTLSRSSSHHARTAYSKSREGSPEKPEVKDFVTPAPGRPRRLFTGNYSSGYALGSSGSGSSGDSAEAKERVSVRGAPESRIGGYSSVARPTPGLWTAGRGLPHGLGKAPSRGVRKILSEGEAQEEDQPADREYGNSDNGSPGAIRRRSPGGDDIVAPGSGSSRGIRESNSSATTPDEQQRDRRNTDENPLATISRRSRRTSPETLSAGKEPHKIPIYHSSPKAPSPAQDEERYEPKKRRQSRPPSPEVGRRSPSPPPPPIHHHHPIPAHEARDKENMPPPPNYRRPFTLSSKRLSRSPERDPVPAVSAPPPPPPVFNAAPPSAPPPQSRSLSPIRQSPVALAAKSSNHPIPLRPAPPPPPPKMSLLQAATAQAGASATTSQQQRRSRATVSVNGKVFRRLDSIGKGGSSKVYKVMAENYKMFALKKVVFNIEKDGEAAIRGYKGEIELLKKLANEDRVVRLYDYEMIEEKSTLVLLMEHGETDLAKLLSTFYSSPTSTFSPSFARYYWSEMLHCVSAVHRHNIIHSDLKPANFLLVSGRLKLIDFGIANAIQDDTVNVHRESQVGTLNYMSPEAIVDINASSGIPTTTIGTANTRLMKIGAPSDVWSLGCILYQMTYGKTPFAHITHMYTKISAIPDPNYKIEYPTTAIGGVPVPRSVVTTIRGCLQRDKNKRPTIEMLLGEEDPWLNPDRVWRGEEVEGEGGYEVKEEEGNWGNKGKGEGEEMVGISREMLRMLLENTVEAVGKSGAPDGNTVRGWAEDVFGKLKNHGNGK